MQPDFPSPTLIPISIPTLLLPCLLICLSVHSLQFTVHSEPADQKSELATARRNAHHYANATPTIYANMPICHRRYHYLDLLQLPPFISQSSPPNLPILTFIFPIPSHASHASHFLTPRVYFLPRTLMRIFLPFLFLAYLV